MTLPVQSSPTYTLTLPSSSKPIRYRPFLVREQKSLLIAQESDDEQVMLDTLIDVIEACLIDKLRVRQLPTFDLEYLFTQIRAKSVGETVEVYLYCDHCAPSEQSRVKVNLDLTKIEVNRPEGHEKNILLFDDVGVTMKYPTSEMISSIDAFGGTDVDAIFETVASCIEYVYDSEGMYKAEDQSHEELIEFVSRLTAEQFDKIEHFFQTMPRLQKSVEFTCPACQRKQNKLLQGIKTFF